MERERERDKETERKGELLQSIEHELRGFAKSPVNSYRACVCYVKSFTGAIPRYPQRACNERGEIRFGNNIRHALMGFWEMELKSTLMF